MRQLLTDIALIPDANRRGKTFERVVKRLLENAEEFRNQFKKVWLWSEYPDATGRDLGIDLVAETRQGTRYAIQAKCYGADQRLGGGFRNIFAPNFRAQIDQIVAEVGNSLFRSMGFVGLIITSVIFALGLPLVLL